MVSKSVCTSSKGAIDYFEDHLNVADYFVGGEKADRGQFIGKVAYRLGLEDQSISREQFVAFAQCDMRGLGANSKRQRTSEIKYIEFTYSPPKAVSVVAVVDERVKGELYAAVKDELRWFETLVAVRDRRGELAGAEVTKSTGQMVAALFQHETSRTNDPDFHVHTLIGNVTWDEERKGYFAVHYGQMLEMRKTLDARIHNNLAARMGLLGYQVETAPSGFGLKEVPAGALAMFSERGHQVKTVKELLQRGFTGTQITAALKGLVEDERRQLLAKPDALKEKMGRPEGKPLLIADHKIDQKAVTLTRPKKVRITSKTLREDVAKRLEWAGLTIEKPFPFSLKSQLDLKEAIGQGAQLAFEKQSVVRLDYLVGEIVRLAPGAVSNGALAARLRDDRHFLIRRVEQGEMVTTRQVLGEEMTLLTTVINGMGEYEPLQSDYVVPALLGATPERVEELMTHARSRGEQLTQRQAEQWLSQFAAIHRYVCTSSDRFLNIRGGAGTGKTFCLERLVAESQRAGRSVFICAPYGEQARVTLRNESPRLEAAGQKAVAQIFAQANTVDSLLMRARHEPELFRGADIYVDEAGLLDTPKALALAREADRAGARIIFQGDTEQMGAVGRGQPVRLLQEEIGLGMHIPRASISRRQLTVADKQLAADLSSGDTNRYAGAVKQMLERGMIRQTSPDEAVEQVAKEIVEARAAGKEMVAVSSVHRISEALAERIHDLHVEKAGREGQTRVDVHVKRNLQPAELRSSQFYKIGDIIEYKADDLVVRGSVVAVKTESLFIERDGQIHPLSYKHVRAAFERSRIERGPGERLLLQEKIKQDGKIFEKGSRQTIAQVSEGIIHFKNGLTLRADDGRVRQADCLTDYKAQGIKSALVRGIEDNGSALAMANKEAFHVKGTRHIQNLILHVENKEVYVEAIQRGNEKFSALQLERMPVNLPFVPSPAVSKGQLLMRVRSWGKSFFPRVARRLRTEKLGFHLKRIQSLRFLQQRAAVEKMAEKEVSAEKLTPKITPAAKDAVKPKLTISSAPTPREAPREGLSSLPKVMRPTPSPAQLQPASPAPKTSPSIKRKKGIRPTITVPQHRRGHGYGM